MTEDTFKKEWDRWAGLWPIGGRKPEAYFHSLRHVEDRRFRLASRALDEFCDAFPTVKQVLAQVILVQQREASDPTHVSIGSGETVDALTAMSAAELKRYYDELAERYVQVRAAVDSQPTPFAQLLKHTEAKLIYLAGESAAIEWMRKTRKRRAELDDLPF